MSRFLDGLAIAVLVAFCVAAFASFGVMVYDITEGPYRLETALLAVFFFVAVPLALMRMFLIANRGKP